MAAVLINLLIVIGTVLVTGTYAFFNEEKKPRLRSFLHGQRYFTTLSNQFSALVSLILLCYQIPALRGAAYNLPLWLCYLRHVATVSVMVTMVTVLVFLGPIYGYKTQLGGTSFFVHLLGPVAAILGCAYFDGIPKLPAAAIFLGLIPTALYGALYLYMVVIRGKEHGGWEDFYVFNKDGKWPISVTLMLAGTLVLSIILWLL